MKKYLSKIGIICFYAITITCQLRNPFCFDDHYYTYRCLALGSLTYKQRAVAVIQINDTLATVRVGDVCLDHRITKITAQGVELINERTKKTYSCLYECKEKALQLKEAEGLGG